MLGDHAVPVTLIVVHGVSIVVSLVVGGGKSVSILPEHIRSNARRVQGILLPRVLDGAVVGAAILLEQAGLASGLAASTVCGHPQVTPAVGGAPWVGRLAVCSQDGYGTSFFELTAVGVQVEGAEVDGGDVQVISPGVSSCGGGEWVRSIASSERPEALVTKSHHVVSIEGLDVLGRGCRPVVDNGAVQSLAHQTRAFSE